MAFNDGTCLCVQGVPTSWRESDLDALFRSYGRVENVRIPVEPVSKGHRGYAFVTMSDHIEAQTCTAALNGVEFSGCRITVQVSKRSAPHVKTPGVYLGLPQLRGARDAGRALHGSIRCRRRRRRAAPAADEARARSGGRVPPRHPADEAAPRAERGGLSPGSARYHPGDVPIAEPLSEPAAAAPAAAAAPRRGRSEPLVEPATEPGGEPLIEEDPCCADRGPQASKLPPDSPRSRIRRLEEANVRAVAKQTVDGLLLQFQQQGFADPRAAAHECLKVSLEVLGMPAASMPLGPAAASPSLPSPQAILGPDEFKNPSSFLRCYGDPLAATAPRHGGYKPESNQDGNWRCEHCSNVNFPRRQRCHKCQEPRGPSGDAIVLKYCLRVYEQLLKGKACD